MRNAALVVAAVVVLAVGLVFVTGDGDEGSGTSAGVTTTQATAAPAATTAAPSGTASTATSTPAPAPEPEVPTLVFANGEPEGGVRKLEFDKGDQIRFRVRSDVDEEVHVHGFDRMQDVVAGRTASFAFPAKFDGVYVVEMEGSETEIASLVIEP